MSETNDEPDGHGESRGLLLTKYRGLQRQFYMRFREITDDFSRKGRLSGVGVNFGLSSWSGEDLAWRAEILFALNEIAVGIPGFGPEERKNVDDEVWRTLVDDELARKGADKL